MPLLSVIGLTLAIVALFPREAFQGGGRTRASADARMAAAGCAFVTLSPKQEEAALAAARTSWQGKSRASAQRIEMLPAELPEMPFSAVIDLASRPPARIGRRVTPRVADLLPTRAAAAPARLVRATAGAPRKPFPRELLLRLH